MEVDGKYLPLRKGFVHFICPVSCAVFDQSIFTSITLCPSHFTCTSHPALQLSFSFLPLRVDFFNRFGVVFPMSTMFHASIPFLLLTPRPSSGRMSRSEPLQRLQSIDTALRTIVIWILGRFPVCVTTERRQRFQLVIISFAADDL